MKNYNKKIDKSSYKSKIDSFMESRSRFLITTKSLKLITVSMKRRSIFLITAEDIKRERVKGRGAETQKLKGKNIFRFDLISSQNIDQY